LHSLVYRYRAKRLADLLGRPNLRNSLTSVILWSLTLIATTIMVLGAHSPFVLLLGGAFVFWLYTLLYRRVALLGPLRKFWQTRSHIHPGE
jgi:Na+-transporting NADH:ubiquinone oxidoreductase subunit NqrB